MSLLPGQILPQSMPFGRVNPDGTVTIDANWWLLIYNLCLQTLGTGSGIPADALIDLEGADIDAANADAIVLRQVLTNALQWAQDPPRQITSADLPDIARALLLAQEALLPDPQPQAQPALIISPTGSPFTYTAPANGMLSVTAGTVSVITMLRQTTSINTGFNAGLIPVSRLDKVTITYTVVPTVVFLPT